MDITDVQKIITVKLPMEHTKYMTFKQNKLITLIRN